MLLNLAIIIFARSTDLYDRLNIRTSLPIVYIPSSKLRIKFKLHNSFGIMEH